MTTDHSSAQDATLRSLRKQLQGVYDILTLVEETHPRKHKKHSPTAVKSRILSMITEIDVLQTRAALDGPSFPHILDRVVALSDYESLMALRGVSRSFQAQADARLFAHIALVSPSSSTPLVNKIKHRVGIAVGPGGYVMLTPTSGHFLPQLPSAPLSQERAELVRAVDYYGPKPSPCVQDVLGQLASENVTQWRSEAEFIGAPEGGGPPVSEGSGAVVSAAFPIVAREDLTFTVRAPARTTAIAHLTWPKRLVDRHETPVIVDLFASASSETYLVVERPDPEANLPLLTLREEIPLYLSAGIAEAFPPGMQAQWPTVTVVGLEGLHPRADQETLATYIQRSLARMARYIDERYGVAVEQHIAAISLDEWEATWKAKQGWSGLATIPHLPYTGTETTFPFW